ncbi:NUDIX hydrolase [Nocardioides marmorisolisilvae]|uniref:NUDIX hydrolase n=1 Tax=Nocardioides marmorisolisilvae TaxID=1542737 RepID=UPI001C8322B8|nr:NUDIX hydrolase [Nocardioides marmorisolisilvae]
MATELTPVSPGVVRVSWSPELQAEGLGPSVEAVRGALVRGFEAGNQRVEALVDPDDEAAQRIATFSGLMREGVARSVESGFDRIVYARLADDTPVDDPIGFRRLLNSFLPRKRAISQMLIRDTQERVLLCQLTYKKDWDLPGGVVEVGESPQLAVGREVEEELGLKLDTGRLVLTDWLPAWGGWDDAVCLVFDGGTHAPELVEQIVRQKREIKSARFCTVEEVHELCADFTARRIVSALINLTDTPGPGYTESGRG